MLTHPTLDQMNALGLAGMATAYRELIEQAHGNDLSFDERLGLMLDREIAVRTDRRLTNRLATAKLRFCQCPRSKTSILDLTAVLTAGTSCLWHKVHGCRQTKT